MGRTHKHSKNVCGVYVPINTNLSQEFDITFDVYIQLDDLLPLSGLSILPNCIIGDIELEIRNRIQGNLVYCQVDPNALIEEKLASSITNNQSDYVELFDIAKAEASYGSYIKEFTQVGDATRICIHDKITPQSGNAYYYPATLKVKLECTNSIMNNAMSHIYGFILKDSVINGQEKLRRFFASELFAPKIWKKQE